VSPAFESDQTKRLQHIISYCLCEHARRLNPAFAKAFDRTALDNAARFLHVNIGSYDATTQRWQFATTFVREWEKRYGRDASVRIATTLLWEVHDGTGLSYRDFSVLCAINSVIGNRRSRPIRITEPRVRVRAAGYKSSAVANLELVRDGSSRAKLLTPHQVRYTLERLHERGFFARARVGAKTVKYMIGVSDADLRKLLLETETRRFRFRAERVQRDRELMAMIRSRTRKTSHPRRPDQE
jgi:hypothetical protein